MVLITMGFSIFFFFGGGGRRSGSAEEGSVFQSGEALVVWCSFIMSGGTGSDTGGRRGGAAVPGVLHCIHGPIRGRDGGQPGGWGGGPWVLQIRVDLGQGARWKWRHHAAAVGYAKLAAAMLAA